MPDTKKFLDLEGLRTYHSSLIQYIKSQLNSVTPETATSEDIDNIVVQSVEFAVFDHVNPQTGESFKEDLSNAEVNGNFIYYFLLKVDFGYKDEFILLTGSTNPITGEVIEQSANYVTVEVQEDDDAIVTVGNKFNGEVTISPLSSSGGDTTFTVTINGISASKTMNVPVAI